MAISKPVISVRNLVTWGNIGSIFLSSKTTVLYDIHRVMLDNK